MKKADIQVGKTYMNYGIRTVPRRVRVLRSDHRGGMIVRYEYVGGYHGMTHGETSLAAFAQWAVKEITPV